MTGLLPASLAPSLTDQTILVAGSNFRPGLSALLTKSTGDTSTFSGTAIKNLTETSFELDVMVPDAGTYSLSVTNPASLPSPPVTLTAAPATSPRPAVVGISPGTPTQGTASQKIYVGGSQFHPGLTVELTGPGGTSTVGGGNVQNVTATTFQVVVTLAEAGSWSLRVVNPGSQASEPFAFTVRAVETPARPTVTGVSPSSLTMSTALQPIYVAGTNFQSGLSVTVTLPNGTTTTVGPSAITFGSSTVFQTMVTLTQSGSYSLRVVNPDGQTSEPWAFTVNALDPPVRPAVTGLSPSSPTMSTAPQPIYVAGTNLQSGLSVTVTLPNGTTTTVGPSAITFGSSTVFQTMVTLAQSGSYSLRVVNPGGQTSEPWTFTVKAPDVPRPVISSVSPIASGSPTRSSVAQLLTVRGTGFQSTLTAVLTSPSGATATFAGSAIQAASSTLFQIYAVLSEVGSYSLRVSNPSGPASEASSFTVIAADSAVPVVIGLSPRSPVQGTASQTVMVAGGNFAPGLTVALTLPNGSTTTLSPSQVQNVTATLFQIVVSFATSGNYSLRVTTPAGASAPWSFAVQPGS
ncbi:MAG TPA: hypothetical protein VGK32_12275 [Vicinamibacterales bacterium]